ncbi:P-loop containing nucleoside triphosphate hydrolase protein [Bisporella sp. PMI_857]|nr:P-loop containing nucleoside triphosphate hydrolase protein [Bisporella sp. PMI_857]
MAHLNPSSTTFSKEISDSPAVKRQRTLNGYTATSAGAAYDSGADDGDELFGDYVPDTPSNARHAYETQPTQILDRSVHPFHTSSSPAPQSVVQVPASSPFQPRIDSPIRGAYNGSPVPVKPRANLAMSMAPAGTTFRPPVAAKFTQPKYITIDDDEDFGPKYKGGSSDDDDNDKANIKPSTFLPRAHGGSSFGSTNGAIGAGNAKFQQIVGNSSYKPTTNFDLVAKTRTSSDSMSMGYGTTRKPHLQHKPERAKAIQDVSLDSFSGVVKDNIMRVRQIFPHVTILAARDALMTSRGSIDDAVLLLSGGPEPAARNIVISDDEFETSEPAKKLQPDMRRGLNAPIVSIKDRYSSTQAAAAKQPLATPPKPKRKLMQGRRHPSSPVAPPTPLKPHSSPAVSVHDYDSDDSGVASASEEDPELGGRVLKYLNICTPSELIELTNITQANADLMIAARPFRNLEAARAVVNPATLKSGKKSARAPIGDKIVDTAVDMFNGYEAIDQLVGTCEKLGKPLADEMGKWGFDVFGSAKCGELEMTSLEDEVESQRDSGIGTPSSAAVSLSGDAADDDVKIVSTHRRRATVAFLKKPAMMADDCVLKDYQVVGLNWLALMYRHELSGILADEMGLGKTCQVISFLSHLIETGHPGPHLIIVPGSTLENWLREFPKFSPDVVVEPYYGAQKERFEMGESILERRGTINVIVTTYDLAAKKDDNKFMRRLNPDVVVFDEGHYLKNLNSQRYQGLVRIPAKFKLLLTGTPLQNNLQELAALLAFILPDVFRERQEDLSYIFKAKATTRDADHAALLSAQRIARARSMLTPFVLRRKKAQVLKHLPVKTCRVEYCSLHTSQKAIYDGHLDQARERAKLRVEGGKVPKTDENNPLMQLRKASIHPLLFRRHFTREKIEKMADILRKKEPVHFPASAKRVHLIEEMRNASDFWLHGWCITYPCISSFDIPDLAWLDSGKVESMVKLVKEYKENGDRVLIFSQFSLVLDILEAVLNSSYISYTRIDGSTKIDERQSLIDTFRDDESITAFLLTTKAGGTGINLMYANKVIIFDGSFNPQDDRQAENRAHRVGQTRNVEVIRLVTRGTIEEQIYALGQSKLELDDRVAGDDEKAREEAGEKAISRMLLEGTGLSEVNGGDDMKAKVEASPKESAKAKATAGKISLQRKKSSILDMVTKGPGKNKATKVDDGIEMLV